MRESNERLVLTLLRPQFGIGPAPRSPGRTGLSAQTVSRLIPRA